MGFNSAFKGLKGKHYIAVCGKLAMEERREATRWTPSYDPYLQKTYFSPMSAYPFPAAPQCCRPDPPS